MSFDCFQITAIVTEHLGSTAGARGMRALMERGASQFEIVQAFANACSPAEGALMRSEFSELPENFVETFMSAWLLAAKAGRSFRLASAPPARPLDFAHRGAVSYTLEHDESGVTMYVSHVHGRHAEWFKPAAVAVAVG